MRLRTWGTRLTFVFDRGYASGRLSASPRAFWRRLQHSLEVTESQVAVELDARVCSKMRKSAAKWKIGPVTDTTGAGDAFVGGLATRLRLGDDLRAAAAYAVAAASSSVRHPGTMPSYPTAASLDGLGSAP